MIDDLGLTIDDYGPTNRQSSIVDFPSLSPPLAPWHLSGGALCLPQFGRSKRGGCIGALCLVRYDTSPVGPYCELAISHLTWLGPTVTTMLVTREASRQGGRRNWGYPKEIAPLVWKDERDGRITFRHGRRIWRARAFGPRLPLWAWAWTVQQLDEQRVRVPVRVSGRWRFAYCGRRLAMLLEAFQLDVLPPRPF